MAFMTKRQEIKITTGLSNEVCVVISPYSCFTKYTTFVPATTFYTPPFGYISPSTPDKPYAVGGTLIDGPF